MTPENKIWHPPLNGGWVEKFPRAIKIPVLADIETIYEKPKPPVILDRFGKPIKISKEAQEETKSRPDQP